jgi:hypothetical protein
MDRLFFCNIGWMNGYEGLAGKPNKIVGGGKYVDKYKTGAEVCNFLPADDGLVYGHVETIKGDIDRQIRLEALGAGGASAEGVTVVWTATHPQEGGRRVIGWYRGATVFRDRHKFRKPPSLQHRRDRIRDFRVRAQASDARRIPIEERIVQMPKGRGWMGQVPWWTPPARPNREVGRFLAQVTALIDGWSAEPEEPGIMVEKRLYRLHRKQERNHAAALLAKQHHGFRCQACAFEFRETYGPLGDGFIEAHHLRPLASLKEGTSGVYDVAKDFAVLCSNCHRMIHRTQYPSDLRGFRALLAQQKLMPRGG